jgi:RimJ/RimL family protein N-acetyltransferase
MKIIEIKKIDASFSNELSILLNHSAQDYTRHFDPFNFDLNSIKSNLEKAENDVFFGIFVEHQMVGFHMLRGWDAGYEIPAYGVFISSNYSGLGLGKLSLRHAVSFCRVNKIKKMMLKVHPENLIAKRLYEASGFIRQGMDKKNHNLIYFKEL